jgi:RNA polymerase sigma-70 factor (ECF subfamily)
MSSAVDRQTFDRLVLEHLSSAQRFAIRLTGDTHAAEDLMQDALLRAHRSWQSFRGQSKFTTWLYQIIINCFRDRFDQVARSEPLRGDSIDPKSSDPLHAAQSHEFGGIVASEVSRLPPRQREVLVLSAYEQMSMGEIAAMLETSEQNVRTNLHFARQRLRERLTPHVGARAIDGKCT